jgi:DNA-binding CsgD family transcriptional regulator
MLQYLGYLIFIISVALSAGGVVLSTRLRNRYHNNIFSSLLYFQVFIYTFGFYGIWGQAIIKVLLSQYLSAENLLRISNIALLLGLPFLVFAWLMLLQFSSGITGRNNKPLFISAFLLVNFSILAAVGYFLSKENEFEPVVLIKTYYIALHFIYCSAASAIILFPGKRRGLLSRHDSRSLAFFIFVIMLIQSIPLLFYTSEVWIAVIFIFVFFAGNTFIPVYLNYSADLHEIISEQAPLISFDDLCIKFDISPREKDIIREICNGLSNKEISEKLFISLQTVKDHTHRIYNKTNVRSRAQLITLVRAINPE